MRQGIMILVGMLFVLGSLQLRAADEQLTSLIKLTGKPVVSYNAQKKTGSVTVSGTTKLIPPGAKIRLQLQFYYNKIDEQLVPVQSDGGFENIVLKPEKEFRLLASDHYRIVGLLRVEDQVESFKDDVKKIMSKHDRDELATFSMGTEEEQKRERAAAVKFINGILRDAIRQNNRIVDEVAYAKDGKKYAKGGGFDEKAWRKFVDTELRPGIIDIQEKYGKWIKDNPGYKLKYNSGDFFMDQFLQLIGFRSVFESRNLYKHFNRKVDMKDITLPPELKTTTRKNIKTSKKAKEYLIDCYQRIRDPYGYDLIPKKKAQPKKPPPKKPAPKKPEKGKEKPASEGANKKSA